MKDLKERAIRGGLAKVGAQGANFVLRIGSLMVLGRLLEPKDFGLVGMVTAIVGVLNLFRDFGLSTASVQRAVITEEQLSTLFWINILVGAILSLASLASAPVVAAFYHEPRLLAVTAALAASFLLNAAGVQHSALLQRQMRFTTSAVVDIVALVASISVGIGLAFKGYGYWALVAMTLLSPTVTTLGLWVATRWVPGKPRKNVGVRSMMRFGGTLTLNGIIVYLGYNLEKILIGRFWGADAIGIYGRAYQLINIPTENLNSSAGSVAFAALSRVQDDPIRLRSYFLKGYSLVLALTLPITILGALFAKDLIRVVLGPKWSGTAEIFRLLAPTIFIFALINPLAWLMFSLGMVGRSLKVAMVLAPVVISGYLIGLPHGPKGVAIAYSSMMALWALPHIAWCVYGTPVSFRDILKAMGRPMMSGLAASILPVIFQLLYGQALFPLARLLIGGIVFAGVYATMLLYVMGQKDIYLSLIRGLRGRSMAEPATVGAL